MRLTNGAPSPTKRQAVIILKPADRNLHDLVSRRLACLRILERTHAGRVSPPSRCPEEAGLLSPSAPASGQQMQAPQIRAAIGGYPRREMVEGDLARHE